MYISSVGDAPQGLAISLSLLGGYLEWKFQQLRE
jgi:hypothetical protein